MKTILIALVAFLSVSLAPAPASAQTTRPLPVEEAFTLEVTRTQDGTLALNWQIAKGYYLYRDHIGASQDGAELPLETSPGIRKDDPTFGLSEVYYDAASAHLAEQVFDTFDVTFQGCQDGGICYAPENRQVNALSLAVSAPAALQAAAPVEWVTEEAPTASEDTGFALAEDDGLIQSLLGRGGVLLVLVSFPLFGLLLAFTPCVFPMYPIMAGALAREGDRLTAWRGFELSSIYVIALASAFALLGAAAGWSGQNLQLVLQSPVTIGILSALFAVLALSMFGLFELQLPTAWTSWVANRTGGLSGSRRSAAILGFSSALIVGPCVTVPLAGALLYIAQTADVALGAAALFGLGIGKGIPLIIMGTLGGKALPRAGAWMESVKRVFGFGFLATAIWTATPLLPSGLDLALWSALLIAIASFAFSAKITETTPLAAIRSVGALSLIYGIILMLGAASGGTDPLKPLARIAQRGEASAPARELAFGQTGSIPELKAQLASAGDAPTLVYFTADWCVTCRVIERSVLPDAGVIDSLHGFQLIKADLSDFNDENAALMKALEVAGPPTMLFFDSAGREVAGTRLVGSVTVENLTGSAKTAGAL
ncbi:protein-disulfide reductase DsbD [Nitratireductor sp. L1-7-SE]|uniref:Protein-disulfide reductase DsbD n=1 Tax=Nitratireductor rhodophyticola TaxID=2854036 RepID=A0ABS7R5G1_9HYPH|nr:protein-disulfide reductase DsbD [Nitratireductor rhodophyticola]MBY8915652.1 protein-disulfide reductase DsbD [Nitratireductor rhodophyticola]MBY8919279.1 protein-disulfide reductase DsbD [Nitratireductor rhodophyticola]